jgi:hypothetical protein
MSVGLKSLKFTTGSFLLASHACLSSSSQKQETNFKVEDEEEEEKMQFVYVCS